MANYVCMYVRLSTNARTNGAQFSAYAIDYKSLEIHSKNQVLAGRV